MRTPEEVAREALEQVRGPMLSIKGAEHDEWQDTLSVLVDQEVEFVADLIRARDAEVAARAWGEGYAVAEDDFIHSDYCGMRCQCQGLHGTTNPHLTEGAES